MTFSTIGVDDVAYPALLREIQSPPSILYTRGTMPNSDLPVVAIVGTRKATRDGRDLAERAASELARAGLIVVSGLAMGIDASAHRGALKAGGMTLAVLGNGIDVVYPAQNEGLANEILKTNGAIVSEYGPDEPSYKGRFIERNRIISGLSLATVVIEAPEKSGAISTARFAAEQGRSVFVFPSSPSNKNYIGSHELIRDGATLVTETAQILEDLGLKAQSAETKLSKDLNADEYRIIATLKDAGRPLRIDMIIEQTTLEPHVVSNILTTLVLEGVIKESNSGYEISNS